MTAAMNGAAIQDFTLPPHQVRFRVNDDVFDCIPYIPAISFIEFTDLVGQMRTDDPAQARELFDRMWHLFMTEDSAKRFLFRLEDRNNPINIEQLNSITQWAMEQYGLRPTEPSDNSSDTSATPVSGPNSTENAPLPGSTSEPSASLVSLT